MLAETIMSFTLIYSSTLPVRTKTLSTANSQNVLKVDRATVADAQARSGCRTSLLSIIFQHAIATFRLSHSGVNYMQCGSAATSATYSRMSTSEFQRINGRQAWANWRTIPQSLAGRLPTDRPLKVLDLCCGTGESTRVLAWWLPDHSEIIAIEQDARFASLAQSQTYYNRNEKQIDVTVRRTSVLDPFPDSEGMRLGDETIDVVHAIGSLGCHFSPEESELIVRETERVLVPGGLAFLDAGRKGTSAEVLAAIATDAGLTVEGSARSWWFDRYEQLALRKPVPGR
jgi:SAM-dependent methyltransferase